MDKRRFLAAAGVAVAVPTSSMAAPKAQASSGGTPLLTVSGAIGKSNRGAFVNELIGKVKSRAFLTELGAEILEGSVIIGDNAYDAETGFVDAPVGSFAEFRKHTPPATVLARAITSDEDLLAAFLKQKL